MRKFTYIFIAISLSFFTGVIYNNYLWNSALGTIMTIPEQSSVERSLLYMDKYLSGDPEAAHKLVKNHALSDPTWLMSPNNRDGILARAIDFSSFEGMEYVRKKHLEKVLSKQAEIRVKLGHKDL